MTDTKLLDGDVLDYFVGSDAENQNDYYTWLEVPATMTSGEDRGYRHWIPTPRRPMPSRWRAWVWHGWI